MTAPITLTIAGFDPSGGAGILTDARTINALGGAAAAAITSLTFQNVRTFSGAIHQTAEVVRSQVTSIAAGSRIASVKIGMLPTVEIVREVARLVRELELPAPVIDPVLRSTSGYQLMESDAIKLLLTDLMPLARVITPNVPEAEALTGLGIGDKDGMGEAASRLSEMGARAVLVKGGHLGEQKSEEREAIDVLDEEGRITVFRGEWINAPPLRGTGCMLSSAIAAWLAKGEALEDAVRLGKQFVADEIRRAPESRD